MLTDVTTIDGVNVNVNVSFDLKTTIYVGVVLFVAMIAALIVYRVAISK